MRGTVAVSLVVVVYLVSFAGCLDDSDGPPTAARFAYDLNGLDGWTDTLGAAPFSPAAYPLIAALAIETMSTDGTSFPPRGDTLLESLVAHPDNNVGDGRAPAWAYLYHSAEDERWLRKLVRVTGSTTATDEWFADEATKRLPPIFAALKHGAPVGTGWLDSHQAVARAREHDAAWPSSTNGTLVMLLHRPAHLDHPVWTLALWTPDAAAASRTISLDALDGEVLAQQDVFRFPTGKDGAETRVLSPAGAVQPHEFSIPVEAGYAGLSLRLSAAGTPKPGTHVHAWLTDPDGNDVGMDDTAWPQPIIVTIRDPSPGTWTLRVGAFSEMDLAQTAEEVSVRWCTDGAAIDPLRIAPAPFGCL